MTARSHARLSPRSRTVAVAQSVTLSPAAEKAAQSQITRATLEAPIRFLADDLLEGRGPATRGDALARLYLARELQSYGYQPGAANGSWEQPIDIVGITSTAPKAWSFTGKSGNVDLTWYDDYIGTSGVQTRYVRLRERRSRLRGLWHRGPRVQVG